MRAVSPREAARVRAGSHARGWLRLLRVREWAHFLLLPLAAFEPSRGIAGIFALARGFLIAGSVLGFGYLLNALADRKTDRPGKNPLLETDVADAWVAVLLLGGIAAGASAWGPPVVRVATALCLASGAAYSVGPRIKQWPLLGTLANATNFAPLLWVASLGEPPSPWMTPLTAAFCCLLLESQLLHEAADRAEDQAAGVRTTVIFLGDGGAAVLAGALGGMLGALIWRCADALVAAPLIVLYAGVFPVALARRGLDSACMTRVRGAHRLSALAAGAWILAWLR
jgi:4-hydroxybenzoate polyprenyltransferase